MLIIACLIWISSPGPIIHWSVRVGRENEKFNMPKFRTMVIDTPNVASHLLEKPEIWLTPIGKILRKYSLDELPQLWSIIRGEMSFVGPRPALFNQFNLILLRTNAGVHKLTPGVTGWAQINGRDNLSIVQKVSLDEEYLKYSSVHFDIKILFLTIFRIAKPNDVSH